MERTDRVALGRFVLRSKEHLVAVRVRDAALALTTMRFAGEIRPTTGMSTGGRKPKKEHVDGALAIIDALTVDWDPDAYEDRYRKRLRAVVRKKEKGKTIKAPEQERAPAPSGDLLEALRKTLQEIRGEGDRSGNGNGKAKTKARTERNRR
jgi:DNA end-binding protein Ku